MEEPLMSSIKGIEPKVEEVIVDLGTKTALMFFKPFMFWEDIVLI